MDRPAIIGAYCYLLGRTFVDHHEAGGTYHDFDAAKLRPDSLVEAAHRDPYGVQVLTAERKAR